MKSNSSIESASQAHILDRCKANNRHFGVKNVNILHGMPLNNVIASTYFKEEKTFVYTFRGKKKTFDSLNF